VSERIRNPKAHAEALRRVREMYRAMAVVAREQTRKMLKQAERAVEGDGRPSDIKPSHEKELKSAAKHAMVEAFKEGRKVAAKKIEAGKRRAPKSAGVRELDPVERVIASVRELDADVLKYGEVAAEYEKWAENVIGGTLNDTVAKAKGVVADGIREGVPWNDYGWDKKLGRNTKEGLKSQLSKVFGDYEDWQLFRVSVTEHTRAVGLGNAYEFDRDEMVVGGRWVVDYKGCEICNPRNGQVYTTAVLRQIHPGHPNCQCDFDPVFRWEIEKRDVISSARAA